MVNWTDSSQRLEGTWKHDEKYDLPVPDSGYECMDLIHQTEDLIALFDYGDDSLADEYEMLTADAVNLLEEITPRDVSVSNYDSDWTNSIKMWKIKNEIYHTATVRDELHGNYLKDVCELYLERLKERFHQLMGEEWEENDA